MLRRAALNVAAVVLYAFLAGQATPGGSMPTAQQPDQSLQTSPVSYVGQVTDDIVRINQALRPQLSSALSLRGAELRTSTFDGRTLTIDVSRNAVGDGSEESIAGLMDAINLVVNQVFEEEGFAERRSLDYTLLIEGEALFEPSRASADALVVSNSISGQRVVLSPGHGYYLTTSNAWSLQRGYFSGIVEDFINSDLIVELQGLMAGLNADVRTTRQLSKNAGIHTASGYPWWQMGASEYVRSLGAPPDVWAVNTGVNRDINARPFYANHIDADILINLHNNGGGGCGTETYYDNSNDHAAASKRLADAVHAKLIERLRADWSSSWCNRGVKGSASYGENRLFKGPAILIELAFMDSNDNAALRDPRFRTVAMTAVRDALAGSAPTVSTPTVKLVSPDTLTQGAPAVQVTLTGSGFTSGSWHELNRNNTGWGIKASTPPEVVNASTMRVYINREVVGTTRVRVCSSQTSSNCSNDLPVTIQAPTVSHTLTVTKAGTGTGTVTSNPTGITCGGDCSESYASGTTVVLTAQAASGSTFSGWSGCQSSSGNACTVSMTAARAVTATFAAATFDLTVTKSGGGGGTVSSSPNGINCGSTCSAPFTSGQSVTLTASAASGSTFGGWSGCQTASGASCTVNMTAARAVTATFAVTTFDLVVTKSGTGSGTVTSAPNGINCGSACSASFTSGGSVTLTASAASGSTFGGWSGCQSSSGTSCTVSMTAARSVSSTFNLSPPTCTFSINPEQATPSSAAGTETVTLTGSPSGCSGGSWSTSPNASWLTVSPSGGTGPGTATVSWTQNTATSSRSGTATIANHVFTVTQGAAVTHDLTVTKSGAGSGTVTSSPGGINCGSACSAAFTSGQSVTLTASAASDSMFGGWSGACTGTSACSVTMSSAQNVTATFTAVPVTTRVVNVGGASGAPGSTVEVPVVVLADGAENGFGFSLTWNTAQLTFESVAKGADAGPATLTPNDLEKTDGKFGAVVTWPTGATMTAGTRELLRVTFRIAANASGDAPVGFGDDPVTREVADASAGALPAEWTGGVVTVTTGFESDVAPRPNGSGTGSITTTDAVQVCRFVAGLDAAAVGSEFQRADTAPRTTFGDGRLTTTDCVQGQRDAAGLDAVRAAAGPTAPITVSARTALDEARMVAVTDAAIAPGATGTVAISLTGDGTENAAGFSVTFDPEQLSLATVTVGSGATAASLVVNDSQTTDGRVGVLVSLPAGVAWAAGTRQLVVLTFTAAEALDGTTTVAFGDSPVVREVASVTADVLPTVFAGGTVTISTRELMVADASIGRGQRGTVAVMLHDNGRANAAGFSLTFDPTTLTFVSADVGAGASGATLITNDLQQTAGRVGLLVALAAGDTWAPGPRELVVLTFDAAAGSTSGTTPLAFSDTPIVSEMADATAEVLPVWYRGGTVTLTAATVPGAPTGVSATAGDASVSVSWTAPASSVGAAITSYTATASPGGATCTWTSGPLSCVVTGLVNGTTYTLTVTATNSAGTGPASSASSPVTPATVPDAPTSVSAVAGDARATVSFMAPSSNGGAAITNYTATASPGGANTSASSSPIVVTGLTNGTSYTFTVTATNSAGTGIASSPSSTVVPIVGVPAAEFTSSTIDFPGAVWTKAFGINDAGDIVGTYGDGSVERGFLLTGETFTSIQHPDALLTTRALGINNAGQIVGCYYDFDAPGACYKGFVLKDGVFTAFTFPGAFITTPNAVNDSGEIVGSTLSISPGGCHGGFLFSKGNYSCITVPGAELTYASSINNSSEIVGSSSPNAGPTTGFRLRLGSFSELTFPAASATQPYGINAAGQVVGDFFITGTPNTAGGFFLSGGEFSRINLSGLTAVRGFNNAYKVVGYSGSTGQEHAFVATLTRVLPIVVTHPASQTTQVGNSAQFTAAATGSPTPAVQWQVSTDGGSTFSDASGATSATYAFTVAIGDAGKQFRAVFTNSAGAVTSDAATLTLTVPPTITTNPADQTVTAGGTTTFTVAASGSPTPSYQWHVSTDAGATWAPLANTPPYSGVTTAALTVTGATATLNTYQYRAVATNTAGSATSAAATLTVNTVPVITTQPVSQRVTGLRSGPTGPVAGGTASFTVAAIGTPAPTYQWQVSTDDGATWTDQLDMISSHFSPSFFGSTTATLMVTSATVELNANQYRALARNVAGGAASAAATLTVSGPPNASPAALQYAATKSGATLTSVTPTQTVNVSFSGAGSAWEASANQSWVQLAGASGSASGSFTVSIINPGDLIGTATTLSATITVTPSTAGLSPVTVPVTLTVTAAPTAPFGAFDTPSNGASVAGSIVVSGWALDDIGVSRVEIWRDRAPGETTPVFTGTGPGNGKIYIADPVFVSGARPDIETIYGHLPLATRAGWGYLMLTQGLWNQGNGSFTFYAFAYDSDGRSTTLGSKTISVSNATAIRPFGSIDTPTYGQTVSGSFWNFGWALTPNATPTCRITNGNVQVSIDSGPLVPVSYGDLRTDIAAAFPGFSNGAGAGGAFHFDISTLSNGTHQIGWYVVDSCNRADGIGSRFFTVLNQESGTGDQGSGAAPSMDVMPSAEPIVVTRSRGQEIVQPGAQADRVVTVAQGERVEVQLPPSAEATGGQPSTGVRYTGYQVVNGERRALPLGSSLDASTGTFYWEPAAAFLGAQDLEFTAGDQGPVWVRVIVGTSVQAAIDTPRSGDVASSFAIAGWAIDQAAKTGTGIDSVHGWAYPATGEAPIFLGIANYGDARPDVGMTFGDQFATASYSLAVDGVLPPGEYQVVVYPHSAVTGDFRGAQTVRVTVR